MRRVLILLSWFLVPFLVFAGWQLWLHTFFRQHSHGSGFEPGDPTWIWLKSTYYGVIGLLFGIAPYLRSIRRWLVVAAGIVALAADGIRSQDRWSVSYVDRGIDHIGYVLSRQSPHVPRDRPLPAWPLPAIPPLTAVTARTPVGAIRIESGRGLLRTLSWDGVSRSLELSPPDSSGLDEYGFVRQRNALYTRRHRADGTRVPGYDWVTHAGINRGTVWEEQIHFQTLAEAEAWLAEQQNEVMPRVWSSDGLVVSWSTQFEWRSLTVTVQQILIDGRKPTDLLGASDSSVIVRPL